MHQSLSEYAASPPRPERATAGADAATGAEDAEGFLTGLVPAGLMRTSCEIFVFAFGAGASNRPAVDVDADADAGAEEAGVDVLPGALVGALLGTEAAGVVRAIFAGRVEPLPLPAVAAGPVPPSSSVESLSLSSESRKRP